MKTFHLKKWSTAIVSKVKKKRPPKFPAAIIEELWVDHSSGNEEYKVKYKSTYDRPDDMKYRQVVERSVSIRIRREKFEFLQERADRGERKVWVFPRAATVSGVVTKYDLTDRVITPHHYRRLMNLQVARAERNKGLVMNVAKDHKQHAALKAV